MEGNARRSRRIQQQNTVPPASTLKSGISGATSPELSSTESTGDNASAKAATRKPRPAKRQKVKADPQANLSRASQSSDASQTTAVIQAARPDPAWTRGRRGHLKFIVEVPLDVLYEIFSELDPIDLLHLSWSCKSLHAIVMSGSGKHLWESAFARLYESEHPPPRCPDDLNLAQYTRFLFVNKCMECGTGAVKYESWRMRLRVCWDCLQSDRFVYRRWNNYEQCSYNFLAGIQAGYNVYYRKSEYKEVNEMPHNLLEGKQLRERHKRKEEGRRDYDFWKSHQIQAKQERLEAMRLVRGSMRLARKPILLQRLHEISWKESEIEEITQHKIDRLPGFARSKPLTDKEWYALRPQLVDRLQELKRAHTERNRKVELHRRYIAFERIVMKWSMETDISWCIQAVDLAILEPFKSALFTFPPQTAEIKFSTAEIDRVAKKWAHSHYNFLLSLLPQELRDRVPAQPKPGKCGYLDFLASLIFRCEDSPFVLGSPDHLSASLALVTSMTPWEWDHPRISFYPEAHEVAKLHITRLGADPNTAILSQVVQCKRELACRWCRSERTGSFCYMSAVKHEMTGHKNRKVGGTQWRVVERD